MRFMWETDVDDTEISMGLSDASLPNNINDIESRVHLSESVNGTTGLLYGDAHLDITPQEKRNPRLTHESESSTIAIVFEQIKKTFS